MIETPTPTLTAAQLKRIAQFKAANELTAKVASDLLSASRDADLVNIETTRAALSEAINRLIKINYAIFLVGNQQDEDAALFLKRIQEGEWTTNRQ